MPLSSIFAPPKFFDKNTEDVNTWIPDPCVTNEQLLPLHDVPGGNHHHLPVSPGHLGPVGQAAGVGHG